MKNLAPLALVVLLVCCQPAVQRERPFVVEETTDVPADGVITSFLGSELLPKELSANVREKHEANLAAAKADFDATPDSLDVIIWYGRRLAYLGRYLEAIKVFSDGLAKYPLSYRLRRHRGHRYITTRQLEKAIADFELAAFNSTNAANHIEPDGLPNRLNRPLSNDLFNIYYHFGLAHYLSGRFDKAVSAYTKCLEFSDNDDLIAATTYWLYMSARRIGNSALAEDVLKGISARMKLVENEAYLNLLLLFKEKKTEEALMKLATNDDGMLNPTFSYGIGSWHLLNGRIDQARTIFWRTLESPEWDAFGYIATEAEIQNMATSSD